MLDRLSPRGRRGLATLLLVALAAWVPGPACGAPGAATGSSGHRTPDQDGPILGAALSVIADGTAPWEDRPIRVDGLGTLPGVRYADDPGDDVGPTNGVVRSGDAIVLRASFSVRGGTVEDLSAEVVLSGPARWDASRLAELQDGGAARIERSTLEHRIFADDSHLAANPDALLEGWYTRFGDVRPLLEASDAETGDEFGQSVALAGDRAGRGSASRSTALWRSFSRSAGASRETGSARPWRSSDGTSR